MFLGPEEPIVRSCYRYVCVRPRSAPAHCCFPAAELCVNQPALKVVGVFELPARWLLLLRRRRPSLGATEQAPAASPGTAGLFSTRRSGRSVLPFLLTTSLVICLTWCFWHIISMVMWLYNLTQPRLNSFPSRLENTDLSARSGREVCFAAAGSLRLAVFKIPDFLSGSQSSYSLLTLLASV